MLKACIQLSSVCGDAQQRYKGAVAAAARRWQHVKHAACAVRAQLNPGLSRDVSDASSVRYGVEQLIAAQQQPLDSQWYCACALHGRVLLSVKQRGRNSG